MKRILKTSINLKDGKLNNGTLIAAAAAIDVIWGGSIRTPVSKNKAIDFILLDMQEKPFRDTFDAAEKAGKGVCVQVKAVSAEVAKLVRGGKDANLAELLNRPWSSAAYPLLETAPLETAPQEDPPNTGVKRAREPSGTPVHLPPPPAIVSPTSTVLPAPTLPSTKECDTTKECDSLDSSIDSSFAERDAFKYTFTKYRKQVKADHEMETGRLREELRVAQEVADRTDFRTRDLEWELRITKDALATQLRMLEVARKSARERRKRPFYGPDDPLFKKCPEMRAHFLLEVNPVWPRICACRGCSAEYMIEPMLKAAKMYKQRRARMNET